MKEPVTTMPLIKNTPANIRILGGLLRSGLADVGDSESWRYGNYKDIAIDWPSLARLEKRGLLLSIPQVGQQGADVIRSWLAVIEKDAPELLLELDAQQNAQEKPDTHNKQVKFYVTREEICRKCNGTKFVQAEIWKDYWEWEAEFKRQNGRNPGEDEYQNWWSERGYWENDPQEPIPPEEHQCPECEGQGLLIEKIELVDALRELNLIERLT